MPIKDQFAFCCPRFGVGTPLAAQIAASKKYGGSDAIAIMYRIVLHLNDNADI
jgi:hypothetical protein